jgi:CRP-like cAMP-binding protein
MADLDQLVGAFAPLARLGPEGREALIKDARVVEAPAGTAILRHGDASEEAYFILSGQAVAGISGEGERYRSLETMLEGDFFGEIAALTGARRTADVVAEEDTALLQVTTEALRGLMTNQTLSQLILAKMTERLNRTSIKDLPRFAGYDQGALRELRASEAGD